MVDEQISFSSIKSQNQLYSTALKLSSTNPKELEKLFSKFLKKSYDLRFWNLYIDYVTKVSTKKVNKIDVFSFVINHFEHSYFSFVFITNYISEIPIDNYDEIRACYTKAFQYPFHRISVLWSEYEKWEFSVGRTLAKTNIEKLVNTYNNSLALYQRLSPYIETNQFFKILDIEMENPLKLQKKTFDARLNFIFNYYIDRNPETDPLLFLYSFYYKDCIKDLNTNSTFLSIWYSFHYEVDLFKTTDVKNKELIQVNYLNWVLKFKGIEAFRTKFVEMKNLSVYAIIYAAQIEYYQGKKEKAYQIMIEGLDNFSSNLLNEEFLKLFRNDDDNIRPLFKKLRKTEKMYDLMIQYEFHHGDMKEFNNLVLSKQIKFNEILPPVKEIVPKINNGCEGIYETVFNSFGFLDLKLEVVDVIGEFISKIPTLSYNENIFINIDSRIIIDLLSSISNIE